MNLPTTPPVGNIDPLLRFALHYRSRGWSIIPVIGKEPPRGMPWKKYQTAPPNERALRQLFRREGITGVAVLLGSVSGGLCCRDFDDLESYERWAELHPDVARTLPTVETHRGRHVYFRGP